MKGSQIAESLSETPELQSRKKQILRVLGYGFSMLVVGLGELFVWVFVCAVGEKLDYIAHPGPGGASFFTLIPILTGPIIFLLIFPSVYLISRAIMTSVEGSRTALRRRLILFVPVAAYLLVVSLFIPQSRDLVDFFMSLAFWFPLLGWRIYASLLDWLIKKFVGSSGQ